jgi:hypothetical protein
VRNRLIQTHVTHSVVQTGQLLLSLMVCLMLSSLTSTAQPRQAPQVAPRCDLLSLNHAYISILNEERHRVDATAPTARFDRALLPGTVLHNELMERLDSLFHSLPLPAAELAGTLLDGDPTEPNRLARLIFERLKASPPHCVIQEDAERTFISISATKNFYCIRLSRIPSVANPRR